MFNVYNEIRIKKKQNFSHTASRAEMGNLGPPKGCWIPTLIGPKPTWAMFSERVFVVSPPLLSHPSRIDETQQRMSPETSAVFVFQQGSTQKD